MDFTDREIEIIINKMEPKIKKSLMETRLENRDDLEQDLRELIIKKLKANTFQEVPDFFEVLGNNEHNED
jgi:hypothetical protein